ncbi:hypothetical protein [Kineosporia sp. NBRC 101731]|uniref:hypothetical protein n=1 Tax=Kineosporia sp. NBRC 101731 TaxID=3032199 RepID=UPI0024A4D86F|nr:hypothetical protein [Kineosporia sp. NBRC 101731]GLY33469.1 hypothetical protein Kisp02_68340 [Kineosporia sp. NBRC 101731]
MNTTIPTEMQLDPNILEAVADVICGDDTSPYYRSGPKISRLFSSAGWKWAGTVEGGRRAWVIEQLHDRRANPEDMQRLILRLADPREYLDDTPALDATIHDLNELLALEGIEIHFTEAGPALRTKSRTKNRLTETAPARLDVDLSLVVHDQKFGEQLNLRLQEARTCWDQGANLAAIIMLGSLLEGVLYDYARSHIPNWDNDTLHRLIELAGKNGWISRDVVDYAHVLRDHRNLIHPRKQQSDGHKPNGDTVRIAWNVVVAALNDLALTNSSQAPLSSQPSSSQTA